MTNPEMKSAEYWLQQYNWSRVTALAMEEFIKRIQADAIVAERAASDRLREALKFYAAFDGVIMDGGERARKALAAQPEVGK